MIGKKKINSAVLAAAGVLASAETDVTVGGKSFIILSEFCPRYEVTEYPVALCECETDTGADDTHRI